MADNRLPRPTQCRSGGNVKEPQTESDPFVSGLWRVACLSCVSSMSTTASGPSMRWPTRPDSYA